MKNADHVLLPKRPTEQARGVLLRVVPSMSKPGELSVRAADGSSVQPWLREAGYQAGDLAVLELSCRYRDHEEVLGASAEPVATAQPLVEANAPARSRRAGALPRRRRHA